MKWLKIFLILFPTAVIIFILAQFLLPFFKSSSAFLKVTTGDVRAKVFLNDKEIGTTPYLGERLRVGDYKLRLVGEISNPKRGLEITLPITLTAQALTAVNYEFAPSPKFFSGDVRTFRIGSGLSIITNPTQADVWLDGEKVGKSPLSSSPTNGVHKLKISSSEFISRELEINMDPSFRLVVEVFLAENPISKAKKLPDNKFKLYDLSTSQESLLKSSKEWAEGVFFFEKNVELELDALISRSGEVFYKDKKAFAEKIAKRKSITIGYLGDAQEKGLTTTARSALEKLKGGAKTKTASEQNLILILSTPTGVLNLRTGPGQNYSIITRVKPGDKYPYLGEKNGWYKIKVGTRTGWVFGQYAKKV